MAMYDVDAPILQLDYGVALSTGKETAPGSGVFTRQFEGGTVRLDCGVWSSTFTPKLAGGG